MLRALATWIVLTGLSAADPWKVAVLHPLLGELATEIGAERVEVIDLMGPRGNAHTFEPSPASLRRAEDARLFLISGMGLESFLPALRGIVGDRLLDVGAALPARRGGCTTCNHGHEPHDHPHHVLDPHWWHSVDRFRRAATVVATVFSTIEPEQQEFFHRNAARYREQLDELERWIRREVARIPRERRHLATAHDAFGYFCEDFGFTAHPVQGINREQVPDAAALAALIQRLKQDQVAAIFPELESNPKILSTLTKDTGIQLGPPLIADGTESESYQAMMRHNVTAIVSTLAPAPGPPPASPASPHPR